MTRSADLARPINSGALATESNLNPGYVAVELERLSGLGLTPRLIEEAAQAPDAAAL
jgi:hypothetical protein